MFKSRGGALAFVGFTLFGAAMLVGTEDRDGALADSIDQIEERRSNFADAAAEIGGTFGESRDERTAATPDPAEEDLVTEFASDEELIVDPTGFDPTPDLDELPGTEIVALDPNAEPETPEE